MKDLFFVHLTSDDQLWKKFRSSSSPPTHLGSSRDYNVDMSPKVR
jgi:hypothetical protein